jgi:PhzF family phenazine biosynthesis protein
MRFSQVDVFSSEPFRGNPLAVVHGAEGLTDEQLARFASWTNLSETAFLLPPTRPGADYRLRIFTVAQELPFAGHPTLGSALAWMEAGGVPSSGGEIVQECAGGLVRIRYDEQRLAFAAPDFLRFGAVPAHLVDRVATALAVPRDRIRHAQWIDNGPGWLGVVLDSADEVLGLEPDFSSFGDLEIGVIGPHARGGPADYEVRAFAGGVGVNEDPVTGSLNAGFGVWLIGAGLAPSVYTVRQGTALGRAGDVDVRSEDGVVWVGGAATVRVSGTVVF